MSARESVMDSARQRQRIERVVLYTLLIIGAFLAMLPMVWMVSASLMPSGQASTYPPHFFPTRITFAHYTDLFTRLDLGRNLLNSAFVSFVVTFASLFINSLAGYAFAKLRFRGRSMLLLVIIATMAIPVQLGLIPLYILMVKLGWVGDLKAVIVPFLVSGFGVFMMRQYSASAVSDELIEAARVDGCSTLRIYWNVVLPAVRPAAAVLGLFTFMQTWNDFLWPYSVLNQDQPTVQLSLATLSSGYYSDFAQIFAGTALATLPLLLVFVLFGRQIIGGIMEGALKA